MRARTHTQQALLCKWEWMDHWHYITKMTTCARSREGGEIHWDPFVLSFRRKNKRRSAMLRQKKNSHSLSLSPFFLDVVVVASYPSANWLFLLHSDCTIERSNAIVAYSVYYYQLRRLARVRTAFRLCVIRLKNTHTDKKYRRQYKMRPSFFVKRNKFTSDLVVVIFIRLIIILFLYSTTNGKSISKLRRHVFIETYIPFCWFYFIDLPLQFLSTFFLYYAAYWHT
jgi:hypothetical protein